MADALCGPSNAIQHFQKHTSADRTLQQDRLITRPSPSQGFRSPPTNAGILDPEFEAFQASFPIDPLHQSLQHAQPSHFTSPPAFQPASQLPGWVSDFQQLQISRAPMPNQQQLHTQQTGNSSAAWNGDFIRQQRYTSSNQAHGPLGQSSANSFARYGAAGFYGQGASLAMQPSSVAQGIQRTEANIEHFDDAAFERAFDAAGADILQHNEHHQAFEEVELGQDVLINEDVRSRHHQLQAQFQDQRLEAEQLSHSSNITNMTIPQTNHLEVEAELERAQQDSEMLEDVNQDENEAHQEQRKDDGDELANTAAQLLDSVAHDTSQKFQESQFLALMRRLRDREVRVEGDQMVDATSAHPHPQFVSTVIPPLEQDHDPGRDDQSFPQMTGALGPTYDTNTDADDHSHDMGAASALIEGTETNEARRLLESPGIHSAAVWSRLSQDIQIEDDLSGSSSGKDNVSQYMRSQEAFADQMRRRLDAGKSYVAGCFFRRDMEAQAVL